MKIDLTCPVELYRCEVPEIRDHLCRVMLYNLTSKRVTSVEVTLEKEGEKTSARVHDLDGRPGTAFAAPVAFDVPDGKAEAVVEKVWFDDNSIWRRSKGMLRELELNTMIPGLQLDRLRYAAGDDAVGFPERRGGIWFCVCGRPNEEWQDACVRCHRRRDAVFADFCRESVDQVNDRRDQQLAIRAKAARENASMLQLEREKAY